MSEPKYGLLAIGNALVDVLSQADEGFITRNGLEKGAMTLIDTQRAKDLYDLMGQAVQVSGGSAGNTMAGFASFGGKGAYIGKVAQDNLGDVFRHDMKAQGIHYTTQALIEGAPTGRCLILVTPDGQRTMNTFLGAAVELSTADIDADLVAASAVTYLEGYLFDPPQAKQAFRLAAKIAREAGRKVALTLSDSFCVGRHRADFLDLVENHVDIVFGNEDELKSLYELESFEAAVERIKNKCEIAVLTRGKQGSLIISGEQKVMINVNSVKVVDTTGAGDQYAAGFLYGYTQGLELVKCGSLGAEAAAEVIGHMGPRPEKKYADFLKLAA
jgi:sugar/nucleoside kinase (ribokinase family)